jgi:hypothetical protein
MEPTWSDLTDDELMARLLQRGLGPAEHLAAMVRYRDEPDVAERITELLEGS